MHIRPEDAIGYWLFYAQRCVAYAFAEALKTCCLEHQKPYIITPSQWGVLSLLYEHDGQTVSTISQQRGIDGPTLTGIVKRLEQNALVERCHDQVDRRIVKVYLTSEARNFMPSLLETAYIFNGIVTRGFSQAKQDDLIAELQEIIANVSPDTGDRFGLLPNQVWCDWKANLAGNPAEPNESIEKEGML